jgi:hypothetical protein
VREIGSTNPDEVRAEQAAPLAVGSSQFLPPPAAVEDAITALDAGFTASAFPRSGLYLVHCEANRPTPASGGVGCRDIPFAYLPLFGGNLNFGFEDTLRDRTDFLSRTTETGRATARYFIPALPPGSQLISARLRSSLVVLGDPAQVCFFGVAPQLDLGFTCIFGPLCFGFATWDLTPQAGARLGGELTITADPIPPGIDINNPPPSGGRGATAWA